MVAGDRRRHTAVGAIQMVNQERRTHCAGDGAPRRDDLRQQGLRPGVKSGRPMLRADLKLTEMHHGTKKT